MLSGAYGRRLVEDRALHFHPRDCTYIGVIYGLYMGYIGVILGLYKDNGKENGNYYLGFRVKGQGDSVSRLIVGISRVTIGVIGAINLLTTPPLPSK